MQYYTLLLCSLLNNFPTNNVSVSLVLLVLLLLFVFGNITDVNKHLVESGKICYNVIIVPILKSVICFESEGRVLSDVFNTGTILQILQNCNTSNNAEVLCNCMCLVLGI